MLNCAPGRCDARCKPVVEMTQWEAQNWISKILECTTMEQLDRISDDVWDACFRSRRTPVVDEVINVLNLRRRRLGHWAVLMQGHPKEGEE